MVLSPSQYQFEKELATPTMDLGTSDNFWSESQADSIYQRKIQLDPPT